MVIPEDKDNEKINDLQNLNKEHCVSSVSRFTQPRLLALLSYGFISYMDTDLIKHKTKQKKVPKRYEFHNER